MVDINKTTVRTGESTKINADLCSGLQTTTAEALELGFQKTYSLFKANPHYPTTRFEVDTTVELDFGLCGPSWAQYLDVEGSYDDQSIELTVSDETTRAGLIAGANIIFKITFKTDVWYLSLPQCHTSPIHCHTDPIHCKSWFHCSGGATHCSGGKTTCTTPGEWKSQMNTTVKLNIDLVNIVLAAIAFIAGSNEEGEANPVAQALARFPNAGGFTQIAEKQGSLADGKGKIELTPKYALHVNILDLVLEATPGLEEFAALNKTLEATGGGFQLGPEFTTYLPSTIELESIAIAGNRYGDLSWDGNTVTGSQTETADADEAELAFEYSVKTDLDFGVGVYGVVTAFAVLSLSASVDFDVSKALGLGIPVGNLEQSVGAQVGMLADLRQGLEPAGAPSKAPSLDSYEVIFEEPRSCPV